MKTEDQKFPDRNPGIGNEEVTLQNQQNQFREVISGSTEIDGISSFRKQERSGEVLTSLGKVASEERENNDFREDYIRIQKTARPVREQEETFSPERRSREPGEPSPLDSVMAELKEKYPAMSDVSLVEENDSGDEKYIAFRQAEMEMFLSLEPPEGTEKDRIQSSAPESLTGSEESVRTSLMSSKPLSMFSGTAYCRQILLKDYRLNQESFDTLRKLSNKPHFTDDRILQVIRSIIQKRPDTAIWGGKKAFTNFMVKALNNEHEYDTAESMAEMEMKAAIKFYEDAAAGRLNYVF